MKLIIEFKDEELLPTSVKEVYDSIVKKSYPIILGSLEQSRKNRVSGVICNLFGDVNKKDEECLEEKASRLANAIAIKNSWAIYNYLHSSFSPNLSSNKSIKFLNIDKIFYRQII